jgi:1-pyrroline-5-carboxylate dehydrogenase
VKGYLDHAHQTSEVKILTGGTAHGKQGYFVDPTVILTENPRYKSMVEEIFGPVLTLFVYDEQNLDAILTLCDQSTRYGLTGAIIAQDRYAIDALSQRLRHAAGNLYINDKPTGAVVGQQPFGGGRASGTNDKAGSALNLYRWLSPRSIKEVFTPPKDYRYPFMREV